MSKKVYLSDEVPVDWGKLLETQLERWRGGGSHGRGIAEYISNSDDSYRRLKQFSGQKIEVEIHSQRGRHIDKLIIRDFAEGMSYEDLENKFFRYFESASGRDRGELVSGRFGTGGKAYAIMNFQKCWIVSVKDGLESRAWFRWDRERKRIVRNYNEGGYKEQPVEKLNQTIVELEHSIKVNPDLVELVSSLEKLARIRHVIRNQNVFVSLFKKSEQINFVLEYPGPKDPLKVWNFPVPKELAGDDSQSSFLTLRYFQRPLGEENFIDLSDGISSVADERLDRFDKRPFSKYFNGSVTLTKLKDSAAVKENRKGLEEGDDLTEAIEAFIRDCVCPAVSEVEDEQRCKEKERRLVASNEKMKELSKFVRKWDKGFKRELKELKKRVLFNSQVLTVTVPEESDQLDRQGSAEIIASGNTTHKLKQGKGTSARVIPQIILEKRGTELATKLTRAWEIWSKVLPETMEAPAVIEVPKARTVLRVLMSDDPNVPDEDRRVFGEFDDPLNDQDMVDKGIIWINANHPLIAARRTESENDPVFLEMVANYVLMVLAQHQAQRQYDAEPADGKSEPIQLFRQKFFKFQRELHEDIEVTYFNID